jgi:hypothetical protein
MKLDQSLVVMVILSVFLCFLANTQRVKDASCPREGCPVISVGRLNLHPSEELAENV